jgi:hypothetical protein
MRPAFRNALLVLLAVVVVAAMVAWFLRTHERVEHKVPLPPRGEAAWNPLYALRETLRADGVAAESRQRLQPQRFTAAARDTVLLESDPALLRPAEVRQLLDWVAGGGHLLLRAPSPPLLATIGDPPEVPALLQALGVARLLPPRCEPLQVQGEEPHVELCSGYRMQLEAAIPLRAWGAPGEGNAFVRLRHGRGTVDLLADFDFLGNDQFDEVTHQALARQLLSPNYGRGTVHLVHATGSASPWWRLLKRGWPLWLPLALLLAAGLWRHAQRFGPWLPSPASGRRSLLEHVRASGALMFRHGQAPLLHEAVRNAFLARLRRRDPASAALSGEAQVQAIAARLQLPHYQVRDALTRGGLQDRQTYFARVRTLIQMRNRL